MSAVTPVSTFARSYEADVLDAIPSDATVHDFPKAKSERALLVRFTLPDGASWLGGFAAGSLAARACSGVFASPSPTCACVVSCGRVYAVDVAHPERTTVVLPELVTQALPDVPAGLLLFADPWEIHAYGIEGLAWSSGRIAIDGLTMVSADARTVVVRVEDADGEAEERRLDVRTGRPMRQLLSLFDLTAPVDDAIVTERPPQEASRVVVVDGPGVARLADTLAETAAAAGFEVRRSDGGSWTYERHGQRAQVLLGANRLGITYTDDAWFPPATLDEGGLGIAGLTVPIDTRGFTPGLARHLPGTNTWISDWRVSDRSPEPLCFELHAALLRLAPRSNGVWPPPRGSTRWRVEAYSDDLLFQAVVEMGEAAEVSVRLLLVRGEPEAARPAACRA